MSHYEQRLEADLNAIQEEILAQGQRVERAFKDAVRALLTGDKVVANGVIIGDNPINRTMRRIDKVCHAFIIRHLPSAGHLRLVSAVMRINIELERIGDYAVTIARETVQQPSPPHGLVAKQLELMAQESERMLVQARLAFADGSDEAAKATMAIADLVQGQFNVLFDELIELSAAPGADGKQLFGLLSVVKMFERVADQSKNICEETVFAITGATKQRKRYRVLFLQRAPAQVAALACAIGRKNYTNSGAFDWYGGTGVPSPQLEQFISDHSLSLPTSISGLDMPPSELAGYHTIISLDEPIETYLQTIPYHTATLTWDLRELTGLLDPHSFMEQMEDIYRDVSVRILQLMETLYGEDAD